MNIFYKIAEWFLGTKLWRIFAKRWMAYFTFRWFGWPKFKVGNYFKIKEVAKAMNGKSGIFAFVSADKQILNYKVNHLITGCTWGHAGIVYWGEDGELRTKEMINCGLIDQYLLDCLREVDDFALIWLPMSKKGRAEALERIKRLDSAPSHVEYDYRLKFDDEFLKWVRGEKEGLNTGKYKFRAYCSGYVYLIGHGLVKDEDFKAHWFAGRDVFEPDNVYDGGVVIFEEHN